MQSDAYTLSRIRPLEDPLRVTTALFAVGALVTALLPGQPPWLGWGSAALLLTLALMIAPYGDPNALYLRAFATDKETMNLRAEIGAVLGPAFRLSGIRPPDKRMSIFLRFLLPTFVGLRYAGSKFMDLEAGEDWLIRLWKTCQTVRIVFIDLADITTNLINEIKLALTTVGPRRVVFLTGGSKSPSTCREVLNEIAQAAGVDANELVVLDASPGRVRSGQFESDLRDILAYIPIGNAGDLDAGRQFILQTVSPELISRATRPSILPKVVATIALIVLASFGLLKKSDFIFLLTVPALIATAVVVLSGVHRSAIRAARFKRAGHTRGAIRQLAILFAEVVLLLTAPALWFVHLNQTLSPLLQRSNETAAVYALRTLNTSQSLYYTTYPELGYACELRSLGRDPNSSQPSARGADLISDELASGTRFGYKFAISNCGKSKGSGHDRSEHYEITAVPETPFKAGTRGFCTDETGEIRFDPAGGTNCVFPAQ